MSDLFDADYWNDRYGAQDDVWSGRPNPVLVSETMALQPGRALDIGCGEGADTIWLAGRGWQVTAVDFSAVALERAATRSRQGAGDPATPSASASASASRITWEQHDVTEWSPPAAAYDLVSAQFMHLPATQRSPLFAALAAAVAARGSLLIVGHDISHRHGPALFPDPDLFFTAEEVAAALDPADWQVDLAESRPRVAPRPDGTRVMVHDAVVSARRR
ncbi:class I SAM-dependent methyltransferase [Cryobacterium arcticum]|uniref:SAM-dependent methyltransferase n=1 Tax=Cryobacterium arcticum TaxID=670052 RepID=A0A317ZMK0_9MICO|nr:class I SAM-dependent methyltransferase [Cryobacterium arcticum]PXA67742.1 SAM-dependent methyltransferase [Cryobacterium arcticum]